MAYGLTKSLAIVRASSQHADASDSVSLSITGVFTAEAWVNADSFATESFIVGKIDGSSTRNWRMSCMASGALRGEIDCTNNGSNGYVSQSSDTLSTGVWTHVAMTWATSATIKLFINGTEVAYTSQQTIGVGGSSIADSNVATKVGGEPNLLGYFWDGKISLVRVWSTERSAANLAANMCSVLGSTTNLAAEWTLDNTYNDNSGNSNTLTASGSPTFASSVPSTCSVIAISVSDQLNITDVLSATKVYNLSVSDQLNITEAVTMTRISNVSVSDQLTITESVTRSVQDFINVSDQLTITESALIYPETVTFNVSDQLTITESITITPESFISVSDQITITESFTQVIVFFINVSDQITVSESYTSTVTSFLSVSDQLTATDVISREASDPVRGLVYMRGQDQGLPVTLNKQDYPLSFNDTSVS